MRARPDGKVPDIRFSKKWRADVARLSDSDRAEMVFLGFTADGVQPFGKWSTKYSCWFFYIELFQLPPELRRRPENLLLVGVATGGKQPKDMQSVLRLLVPSLDRITLLQPPMATNELAQMACIEGAADLPAARQNEIKQACGINGSVCSGQVLQGLSVTVWNAAVAL